MIGELLRAQLADNRARSTAYRMGKARFPLARTLAEFDFAVSPVNETLVRELHQGGFLASQRNTVLVGGTGTGKSHLAIAIAANCVRSGARGRFFNTVDLVNQLEAEARIGKTGQLADQLVRADLVVFDELGYLPFPVSGGQMLFHLTSKLYEHTSIVAHHQPGLRRVAEHLRRRQDDHGAARSAHPSLRHHRDRQRELALQAPCLRLAPWPADRPRGPTAPPHARHSVAREGTARRARVPSVDSGDDRYSTISMGRDWALIPGHASALIDKEVPSIPDLDLREPGSDRGSGLFGDFELNRPTRLFLNDVSAVSDCRGADIVDL